MENMVEHINDIAGVRIVCSFTSDIYRLADMIGKQKEFTILYIKDYMKHPKESGYRSYHMLITVPIQTTKGNLSHKGRDSDPDHCHGFLGKSGTQDLLQI